MKKDFPQLEQQLSHPSEDGLDEALLSKTQHAALRYFEAYRPQIWEALCDSLQETIEGWEAEDAAREAARRRAMRHQPPDHETLLYGESVDDGRYRPLND
jgi:hypothetical protein